MTRAIVRDAFCATTYVLYMARSLAMTSIIRHVTKQSTASKHNLNVNNASHPPICTMTYRDKTEERRVEHHEADIVIVGAGIFGCAAAVAFSKQGRSVILLERSLEEPDRIVGEALQPGGIAALEKLGLRDCLEGIDAQPLYGYTLLYNNQDATIPYPSNNDSKPEGRSFHHGRFVANLRRRAMACPNVTVVETIATDLVRSGYTDQVLGVQAKTDGKQDYYFGHLTFIADGYASKFRKTFVKHSPIAKSKFWALELIDADLPSPRHGHVVMADGALTLLYQIGTHETRALCDIPDNTPTAHPDVGGVKNHLRNVVLPSLPAQVRPSFSHALEHDRLRSMPNSWLPPTVNRTPGIVLVGDAMNMRHPLTGGGMTVALNDAVMLADLLSPTNIPDLDDTRLVLSQLQRFHWQRKHLTSVINVMAQALYNLFAADDAQLQVLQNGVFRYLQIEGSCKTGPGGLLGGLIQRPLVLIYHFFSVALYAIWLYLTSATSVLALPARMVGSVGIFYKACVVLFPFVLSELRT